MRIGIRKQRMTTRMNANSDLTLQSIQASIDLESNAVVFKNNPNIQAWLKPSSSNDRIRSQSSKLGLGFEFDLQEKPSTHKFMGEYGYMWAKQYHGNKYALPSIKEIFQGLYKLRMRN